ncbi:PadR family transcriptional regulator [Nocardioides marmoraquaticus]
MWNDEPRRRQHGGRRNDMGWGAWGGQAGPMGPPPWLMQMFGPEMGGRRGRHGGGRPRVRRGDVRSAILDVLAGADEPVNGYQVIQQIAERTGGQWKPSPGSVYPTIQQLEDEGLVEDAPTGRKALQLTAEGRDHVRDHADEMAALWKPFETEDDVDEVNFKQVIGQTVGAIVQVMSSGTPDQRDKALGILSDTRRRLYGLLADGPEGDDADPETDAADELDGHEGR